MNNNRMAIIILIFLPCLGLTLLPPYFMISGSVSPSEEHLVRASEYFDGESLIQIAADSGEVVCNLDTCDYSKSYDQKQYTDLFAASKIVTIRKEYSGEWFENEQPFTVELKAILISFYLIAVFGLYLSSRYIRKV